LIVQKKKTPRCGNSDRPNIDARADWLMKLPPAPTELWLPTGRALDATGLSRTTLHRWKRDGFLLEGEHFRHGLTPRSPLRWNVPAIELAIASTRELPDRPAD